MTHEELEKLAKEADDLRRQLTASEMRRKNAEYMAKQMRDRARALELGLQDAGKRCEQVHHDARDRHASLETCPVEERLYALLASPQTEAQPAEPTDDPLFFEDDYVSVAEPTYCAGKQKGK